jgi:4-amino-4-deoxychorismate lyase
MLHTKTKKPLLLETIKIEDGFVYNLPYHQQRCTRSREILYGCTDIINLQNIILPPDKGLYRCRILYHTKIQSIEYIPYTPKEIHKLKIVPSSIEYDLKYADRKNLDTLLDHHEDFDEIIIEKEGYLRDTTISNIAFHDGEKWITPKKPLLKGTMREKLLDEGFLYPVNIKKENLHTYTQVALINAMVGFKPLNNVYIEDTKGKTYDY